MPLGVAQALAVLEQRGWTLTAVADELGVKLLSVYRWRDGNRTPENPHLVLDRIDELAQRVPPSPGPRQNRSAPER